MKLSLVGVALCCVVGLVPFGSFAWDKVGARGVGDGGKLVEGKCVEIPDHHAAKVFALCEWRAVR